MDRFKSSRRCALTIASAFFSSFCSQRLSQSSQAMIALSAVPICFFSSMACVFSLAGCTYRLISESLAELNAHVANQDQYRNSSMEQFSSNACIVWERKKRMHETLGTCTKTESNYYQKTHANIMLDIPSKKKHNVRYSIKYFTEDWSIEIK